MYAGQVVEYGSVGDIFSTPLHPYTVGLLEAIPRMDGIVGQDGYLRVIPGVVPDLHNQPRGCRFFDRCSYVMTICSEEEPALKEKTSGHPVRCWRYV